MIRTAIAALAIVAFVGTAEASDDFAIYTAAQNNPLVDVPGTNVNAKASKEAKTFTSSRKSSRLKEAFVPKE